MKPALLSLVAALALTLGASAAVLAQDGGTPAPEGRSDAPAANEARKGGKARLGRRHAAKHLHARGEMREQRRGFAKALQFTTDQERLLLEKARAAQPLVEQSRRDLAKAIVEARAAMPKREPGATKSADGKSPEVKAAREAVRAKIRGVRTASQSALEPLAKDVVAALTPEQRARIEGFAAARGRKLDDAALGRLVGRMLRRPMLAPMLEAKLSQTK